MDLMRGLAPELMNGRDGQQPVRGGNDSPLRGSVVEIFEVGDSGRVTAASRHVAEVAECMVYIAEVSDAAGFTLGAGSLLSIELLGSASLYATVDRTTGRTRVRGALDPVGGATESLRYRLAGGAAR